MSIALDNAISGLRAAQRHLDVISNNISNAGVDGYTRKILPQETLLIGGEGAGVKLNAILRKVDMTLMRDLVKQSSVASNSATTQTYLNRIQEFHGATDAERSIAARLGKLNDAFADLSTAPNDGFKLANTVSTAQDVARAMNDFNTLLSQMRNDIQTDIKSAVNDLNQSLQAISTLNQKIAILDSQGGSTAELEDERDRQIKNVSKYVEVSSYTGENKKIVLMTRRGETLVDDKAKTITFDSTPVSAGSYYPGGGINGILIEGIDITQTNMGGKLGALVEMRDQTLPTYQSQLDELAQKTAERFDALGLRLFTDANRLVPASTTPPTPVSYIGFAGEIRVNPDILADNSLLRTGTYGQTALPGSNEMVRKVLDYAFGINLGQTAVGTTDISVGTIFSSTSLTQSARLIGTVDLTDYTPDLDAAPNITAPGSFQLTIGGTPYAIAINPGDTATDLVNTINTAVGSTVADLNGIGQLRLNTTADINIADISLGLAGLADLGLTPGTTMAQNPSFTVQVGTQSAVTVDIAPSDTAADILLTLNTIPGLSATLSGGGLVLTPTRGGSISLANVSGEPLQALNLSVANVAHAAFRTTSTGPDGSLSTGLVASTTFTDYSRSMIASQSEDHAMAVTKTDRETSYLDTLSKRASDESGVNIDQELAELIRVQTSYSAAARMISAAEQMMDELFNAFR